MRAFLYFSDFIVPFIMFYIVIYGFFNKSDVYENFLDGVKEGFKIVVNIAPTMVALLVSIGIFRASGALDFVSGLLEPVGSGAARLSGPNLFFFGGHKLCTGYLQGIWPGFQYRDDGFYYDELYGNGNLHYYDLLYEREDHQNKMDSARSHGCYCSRNHRQRGDYEDDHVKKW